MFWDGILVWEWGMWGNFAAMKRILFLWVGAMLALGAAAQKRTDASAWTVQGYVINEVTRRNVLDTIKVSLISADGVAFKSLSAIPRHGEPTQFQTNLGEQCAGKWTLRLEHPDYTTAEFPFELTTRRRVVTLGALPMHKLTLSEKKLQLGELTVTATKVKFFHKGDTIVYNADAFNLAQGSMLDGLIEQLPGVQLDANGVIKVNGRQVESLLLNGREFFKGKQGVMLENLPAYMVKDVKVYESLSEEDKLKGMRGNELLTMNVSLKKEFTKGVIANAEVGGGTHWRYAARAFGLLYSDQLRLSAYGKINNTNVDRTPGRDGNWGGSYSRNGRPIIRQAGFDYQVYGKENKYEVKGTLTAAVNDQNQRVNSFAQNFLPDGNTYTARFNNRWSRSVVLNTQTSFTLTPNPAKADQFNVSVNGNYTNSRDNSATVEGTFNQNPESESLREELMTGGLLANSAVNRLLRESRQRSHGLSGSLSTYSRLSVKGRDDFYWFSAHVQGNSSVKDTPDDYRLYHGAEPQSVRSRLNVDNAKGLSASFATFYFFKPNNHLNIRAEYSAYYKGGKGVNDWYTSERTAQTQSEAEEIARQLDVENSYHSHNHRIEHQPQVVVFYDFDREADGTDDGYVHSYLNIRPVFCRSVLDYQGVTDFRLAKNFFLPNLQAELQFTTHKKAHYLDVKYYLNTQDPTLMSMADVVFTSDPLNIRRGNPELKSSMKHHFESNYRADGLNRNKGIWLSAQVAYSVTNRAQAMNTVYDRATGVRTTTPINIDGNWQTHARSDMQFPLTRDRNLTLGTTLYYDYSESADMTSESAAEDAVKTLVCRHSTWDILSLEYKFGRHRLKAKGELNFSHLEGTQSGFRRLNIWTYNYGLNGTFTLPLDFQISTDFFVHSKRGYADPAANYNSLVWNATVSKPLLKGSLIVKLDAFDILHQIRNTTVSVNAQGRTETTYNTLPAYFMLRLAYNFSRQPKQ